MKSVHFIKYLLVPLKYQPFQEVWLVTAQSFHSIYSHMGSVGFLLSAGVISFGYGCVCVHPLAGELHAKTTQILYNKYYI